MAVPGNVLSGRNRGATALLRDGAKMVETADDILEELGCLALARTRPDRRTRCAVADASARPGARALDPAKPTISSDSGDDRAVLAARLLPRLFDLELPGRFAGSAADGSFRADRPC